MTAINELDKVVLFLDLLELDINNKDIESLNILDNDLISYVQSLFINQVIDIDAPIIDED